MTDSAKARAPILAAGGILLLAALLGITLRRRLMKWLKSTADILKRFRPATALKLLAGCCIRLLTVSLTYFSVLILLGQNITLELVPQIIGLFVLSWVIGFVMPGAPGGLGIREVILIMFLGDALSQSILLSSTIIHRVVCISGDILAYVMSLIYAKMK